MVILPQVSAAPATRPDLLIFTDKSGGSKFSCAIGLERVQQLFGLNVSSYHDMNMIRPYVNCDNFITPKLTHRNDRILYYSALSGIERERLISGARLHLSFEIFTR